MIVAPARSAMRRCVVGRDDPVLRSEHAQLGIVFQAGAPIGATFAPRAIGRWLATISQRSASGRSCANASCTVIGLEERLGVTFGSARVAGDVEDGRRVGHGEGRAGAAEDREDVLAFVGDERVDVDERLDVPPRHPRS